MTEAITNPHDHFFKATFARHEAALDFVQSYLPPEIVQVFDLATLEINKDSFVDSELKEHFSDILYKIGLQSGGQACIYILFEHKSYPDYLVAFQLLRYMLRIWEQQLQQYQEQKEKKKKRVKQQKKRTFPFKPILPLVVYHGTQGWHIDLSFAAIFDKADFPDVLKPYVPDYQYMLFDLSKYTDEEIKGQVILQVTLLLLKYIKRDDLIEALSRILPLLIEVSKKETGLEYIETVLKYLAVGTEKITEEELNQLLNKTFTKGDNVMSTLAQQWVEQGEKKGIEIGQRKAKIESLNQIITIRFLVKLGKFEKKLAKLNLETLKNLTEIALKVETLAEFEKNLTKMLPKSEKNSKNGKNGKNSNLAQNTKNKLT